MVSSQDPSPLNGAHTLCSGTPMALRWDMHTPLCPGGGGKALPLPQCCTLLAREEITLPCASRHDDNFIVAVAIAIAIAGHCHHSLHCHCRHCCCCHHHHHCHCNYFRPLPLPSPSAITFAVAISHCRRHWRWSLLFPLPLAIAVAGSVVVTIAIAISIGNWCCHCRDKCHLPQKRRRPSLESCCLGAATIIFKQLKQIILTFFILFGQWAPHWLQRMTDQESGSNGRWSTPVLGGKRWAARG